MTSSGKVIGKKGNVIQEILEKSRVHNVKVVGDEEARGRDIDVQALVCCGTMVWGRFCDPSLPLHPHVQVPFDFIGRKTDIDNAKMMMEYHLEHLKVYVFHCL